MEIKTENQIQMQNLPREEKQEDTEEILKERKVRRKFARKTKKFEASTTEEDKIGNSPRQPAVRYGGAAAEVTPSPARQKALEFLARGGQTPNGRTVWKREMTMDEFSTCTKCGEQIAEQAAFCRQCGGRMLSSSKARNLGWAAAICGGFVVALMGFVFYWEMQPDTYFSGTRQFWWYGMTVESLVACLGTIILAGGVSQIKQGKRNKTLNRIGLGLLSVLVGVITWERLFSR